MFRKSEASKWAWSNISANVPKQAIQEADSEELIREENFNNTEMFRYAKSKNDNVPNHEGLLMDIEVSVQERSKKSALFWRRPSKVPSGNTTASR